VECTYESSVSLCGAQIGSRQFHTGGVQVCTGFRGSILETYLSVVGDLSHMIAHRVLSQVWCRGLGIADI
jgi:hypothetical protein